MLSVEQRRFGEVRRVESWDLGWLGVPGERHQRRRERRFGRATPCHGLGRFHDRVGRYIHTLKKVP